MKLSISRLFATAVVATGLSLAAAAPTPEPFAPQGRIAALNHARHRAAAARHAFGAAHRRFPRDEESVEEVAERSEGENLEERAFGPAGFRPGAHHFGAAKAKAFRAAKSRAFRATHRFAPRDEEAAEEFAERSEGEEIEERAYGPAGLHHPGAHRFGATAKAKAFRAAKARAFRATHRIGRRDEDGVEELAERSEEGLEERAYGPAGFRPGRHHFGAAKTKGFKAARLRALKAGRRFSPRDEMSEEIEARAFGPAGSHFGAAARGRAFKQRNAFRAAKFGGARRHSRLGGRDEIPEEQA